MTTTIMEITEGKVADYLHKKGMRTAVGQINKAAEGDKPSVIKGKLGVLGMAAGTYGKKREKYKKAMGGRLGGVAALLTKKGREKRSKMISKLHKSTSKSMDNQLNRLRNYANYKFATSGVNESVDYVCNMTESAAADNLLG